jgi:hypothetical protein
VSGWVEASELSKYMWIIEGEEEWKIYT